MAKRTNVILPEATVRTLDRLARPGQRSRFIDRAVHHYVTTASPEGLQEGLKQAALRDRDLDLEIASAWNAPATGWVWIKNNGGSATSKKSRKPRVGEKRRNLPRRAQPGGRAGDRENQACAGHPERHIQPLRRRDSGCADHINRQTSSLAPACPAARRFFHRADCSLSGGL